MPYTREQKLAAKAAYREKNREQLAAKQREYHAGHREDCNERSLAYQRNNPERRTAYRAQNKDRINEKGREWTEKNRESLNAKTRAWYHANKDKVQAYREKTREKRLASKRAYNEANKDKIKAYYTRPDVRARLNENNRRFKERYPEKQQQYQHKSQLREIAELEAVAGRPRPKECEVCGRTNKSGRAIHFDHCHQRGHFRGWLCSGCNTALGHVNDDVQILRKLIAYLQRTGKHNAPQLTLGGI